MANLPINQIPFVMTSHPFYNPENFPNSMYRRYHPRQHNPLDRHAIGVISSLKPYLRHMTHELENTVEDLAQIPQTHVNDNKDHKFHVYVDVGVFAPEDLTVKVINDDLVIEGKHEERRAEDVGYVSRHFVRRYELPKGYNADDIVSQLSADGVASVILPKTTDEPKEHIIIPIQRSGSNEIIFKNESIQAGEKDEIKSENEDDKMECIEEERT